MKNAAWILVMGTLAGCATSSGIIPEGKEGYLIIATSGKFGYPKPVELKIEAHKQASEFCSLKNKRHETESEKMQVAGVLSDYTEYELSFKCVGTSDTPALVSPPQTGQVPR